MGLFENLGDKLKKAATEKLGAEAVAKAAELAKLAQEKARAAAEQVADKGRDYADQAANEARRRHAEWQEAQQKNRDAERADAAAYGLKAPLTYELKKRHKLPISRGEEARQATAVESERPGAWFAPFSQEMEIPVWLSEKHPFFTGKLKLQTRILAFRGDGQECWALDQPVPAYTVNAVTWLYECLFAQALYERWRRGYPVLDSEGMPLWPKVDPDGYPIIEREERDDGSVVALVADFGSVPIEAEEQRAFRKAIGGFVWTQWKGKQKRIQVNPVESKIKVQSPLSEYAFARPYITSKVIHAADPNRNPYAPPNTSHGSAQFAWVDEMAQKRLIVAEEPWEFAGHTFLGLHRYRYPDGRMLGHMVTWCGDGHRLIVGPPGSGKFTSAIAQLLLKSADTGSAFVFDVKNGEAAKITGEHRAKLGPVTVLDPFGITGMESGAINPIDLLREDGPELVSRAERLADAIYVPSSTSDPFWDHAAKKLLAALLMHIGTSPVYEDGERNLKTLRNIVREQVPLEVLAAMRNNPAGDGEVAAEGKAQIEAEERGADKQRYSVVQNLNVNIGFLKVPQILSVTDRTTFDPHQLKERVSTLYVVTPDHQLETVNRWVRMIYAYVMEQLREARGACDVHVVMDEFPALGKFERVPKDMAQTRSLGVHMHVVVQTFQQLLDTYGPGWERFQGTSAVTHVLGVRDNFTAEQISKMLGQTTVRTTNRGVNRANNGGGGVNEGEGYAGRPLMTPDELLTMPDSQAIAIIGGVNPVKMEKVAYFSK